MSKDILKHIDALQDAIKAKKKDFRLERAKAYATKEEESEDDLDSLKEDPAPKETPREEVLEEDDEFLRQRREFMKGRKRTSSDAPSIALFDRGGRTPEKPKADPKQAPKAEPARAAAKGKA